MKILKTHLREYNPLFHKKLLSLFYTYNHESTEHFEHFEIPLSHSQNAPRMMRQKQTT